MFKVLAGFCAGVCVTLAAGFVLCEVAERCELPLEAPDEPEGDSAAFPFGE